MSNIKKYLYNIRNICIIQLTPDTCRAETAEAQMMKTGDFSAPAKEDWGAEGGVEDWSADGQTAAPAAAPPAIAAPAQGYQVRTYWD